MAKVLRDDAEDATDEDAEYSEFINSNSIAFLQAVETKCLMGGREDTTSVANIIMTALSLFIVKHSRYGQERAAMKDVLKIARKICERTIKGYKEFRTEQDAKEKFDRTAREDATHKSPEGVQ